MLTTLEATLEKDGTIRWIEPLPGSRYRILVTLLEKLPDEDRESSLLAEAALPKTGCSLKKRKHGPICSRLSCVDSLSFL